LLALESGAVEEQVEFAKQDETNAKLIKQAKELMEEKKDLAIESVLQSHFFLSFSRSLSSFHSLFSLCLFRSQTFGLSASSEHHNAARHCSTFTLLLLCRYVTLKKNYMRSCINLDSEKQKAEDIKANHTTNITQAQFNPHITLAKHNHSTSKQHSQNISNMQFSLHTMTPLYCAQAELLTLINVRGVLEAKVQEQQIIFDGGGGGGGGGENSRAMGDVRRLKSELKMAQSELARKDKELAGANRLMPPRSTSVDPQSAGTVQNLQRENAHLKQQIKSAGGAGGGSSSGGIDDKYERARRELEKERAEWKGRAVQAEEELRQFQASMREQILRYRQEIAQLKAQLGGGVGGGVGGGSVPMSSRAELGPLIVVPPNVRTQPKRAGGGYSIPGQTNGLDRSRR
jgi:hypothetical protein